MSSPQKDPDLTLKKTPSGLQIFPKEFQLALIDVFLIPALAQEVVVVGVYLHLKLFAGLYKGIHIQPRLLAVNVVVG